MPRIQNIEENLLVPTLFSQDTAVPVFLGYTEKAENDSGNDLKLQPHLVHSMADFEANFGFAAPEAGIEIDFGYDDAGNLVANCQKSLQQRYSFYYCIQMFFANGGGKCYIISIGNYSVIPEIRFTDFESGLSKVSAILDATLLSFPEAVYLRNSDEYYYLLDTAIAITEENSLLFVLADLWQGNLNVSQAMDVFRQYAFQYTHLLGNGAIFFPQIISELAINFGDLSRIRIINGDAEDLAALKTANYLQYILGINILQKLENLVPASTVIAAKFSVNDKMNGIWNVPSAVPLNLVEKTDLAIDDAIQQKLNHDPVSGKSINALRKFPKRGVLIWGARTMDSRNTETRYISVMRMKQHVRETVRKAAETFHSEENNMMTWRRLKLLIEQYLFKLWKAGALAGNLSHEACFVRVGVGTTMTEVDVQQKKLKVLTGLAFTKPSEFQLISIEVKMK